MKSKSKSTLAILLVFLLIISALTGCGKKETGSTEHTSNSDAVLNGDVYLPEYISLPFEFSMLNNVFAYDNKLIFSVSVKPESNAQKSTDSAAADNTVEEYIEKLYIMNLDGTGLTELINYTLPAITGENEINISISSLTVDGEGNIWVIESGNNYHIADDGSYVNDGSIIFLRKLDASGAELFKADISRITEENKYFYIKDIQSDNNGNFYISDGNTGVYVIDSTGKQLFKLISTNWIYSLIKLSDGSIAAMMYENGYKIKAIDSSSKNWGKAIPMPVNSNSAYSGSDDYLFYYSEGSCLYGYNAASQLGEKLLSWIDCDINGDNISSLTTLPDGRIVCFLREYAGEESVTELAVLSKHPASSLMQKTLLKMACFGLDSEMRAAIINFNKTNDKYRVTVTDYSEFSTEDDYSAGLTKFNTELISGNIPDLICTYGLPINKYINKGLFEDLYPYLDKDTALGGRDALIKEVLHALESNGALYQIASGFGIASVAGNADIIGEESGWTLSELIDIFNRCPKGTQIFPNVTSDQVLELLAVSMDEYINWETGECFFNDKSFIEFLEFANLFSKDAPTNDMVEDEIKMYQDGSALLMPISISGFEYFQMYRAIFNGNVSYKGFPNVGGNGSVFEIYTGVAMSNKSEHKDGAWEFIRSTLTEEHQSGYYMWQFPTNKAAFEMSAKKAMEKETYINEKGEEMEVSRGSWGFGDLIVDVYAARQEDVDLVKQLISSIESTIMFDEESMKIIREEAAAYFSGQKSVTDTADIIQKRINTYINEQR